MWPSFVISSHQEESSTYVRRDVGMLYSHLLCSSDIWNVKFYYSNPITVINFTSTDYRFEHYLLSLTLNKKEVGNTSYSIQEMNKCMR
jgi:hypothetical protein